MPQTPAQAPPTPAPAPAACTAQTPCRRQRHAAAGSSADVADTSAGNAADGSGATDCGSTDRIRTSGDLTTGRHVPGRPGSIITVPLSIVGAARLSTVSLTITYEPGAFCAFGAFKRKLHALLGGAKCHVHPRDCTGSH